VVSNLAADVAFLLVLLENLNVERYRLVGPRERTHRFLHAGENLLSALTPISSSADRFMVAVSRYVIGDVGVTFVRRYFTDAA
jgi:hypothetical protein